MTYAQLLAAIDDMIRHNDIHPVWWRTVRTSQYRAILRRLRIVSDIPRVPLIEGDEP